MPTLPIHHAKPLRPDTARLGPQEARREETLLASPAPHGPRFPGDGGRVLPAGGGLALRNGARIAPPVWYRAED